MGVLYVVRQRGSSTNGHVSLFSVLFFFCDTSPHFVSYPYSDSYFFASFLFFLLSFFSSFLLSSSSFFPLLPSFLFLPSCPKVRPWWMVTSSSSTEGGTAIHNSPTATCSTPTRWPGALWYVYVYVYYLLYLLYTPSVFLSSSHPHSSIAHA